MSLVSGGHWRRPLRLLPVAIGLSLIVHASWIHIKAYIAQHLLRHAWAQTQAGDEPQPPWPWADTWPVGRLSVTRLDIDQIVLANASGRNLAFGPVHIEPSNLPGEPGHVVLSGHRDTHFGFLKLLQSGDIITMEDSTGTTSYRVSYSEIIDLDQQSLQYRPERNRLTLVTCYPFDAVSSGTRKRFLVHAAPVTQLSQNGNRMIRLSGSGMNAVRPG